MARATFRFHGGLNDFLSLGRRGQSFEHQFEWRASIKDMIESLGPHHAEVELIVVSGVPAGFDYIVEDGDRVDVYTQFDAVEMPGKIRLRPPLPLPPHFVLDVHLGRLASYLRMMGFDTVYGDTNNHGEFDDALLARVAHDENRVLLSRDIGLLKRSLVTYGYWVRSTDPRERLVEIVRRFGLVPHVRPFRLCMKCNGQLEPVDKALVVDQLWPDTVEYVDTFHRCSNCQKVYWRGSHTERMEALIASVLASASQA